MTLETPTISQGIHVYPLLHSRLFLNPFTSSGVILGGMGDCCALFVCVFVCVGVILKHITKCKNGTYFGLLTLRW